jgi:hypothetical protein
MNKHNTSLLGKEFTWKDKCGRKALVARKKSTPRSINPSLPRIGYREFKGKKHVKPWFPT